MIPIPSIVYAILIASSIGFYSGYQVKSTISLAEKARILQIEREKLLETKKISANLLSQLEKEKSKVKIVYKTIVKKVPIYATKIQKTDSFCNLTIGSKRMLDNSINSMPSATRGIISPDTKASRIREIDLIIYLTNAIKEYNLVKAQCNSLIKWYNKTKE